MPWQRLVTTIFGIGTVGMMGLLGLEVGRALGHRDGGRRLALVCAAIAAIYPNLWIADALVMSESFSMFLVAALLVVSVRWLHRRDGADLRWWPAIAIGLLAGVTTQARSEIVLVIPLLAVLAFRTGTGPLLRRAAKGAVLVAAAGAVLAPWVIYNLHRFERPVYLSTNDGTTLLGNYNDEVFYGSNIGGWSIAAIGGPFGNEVYPEPSIRSEVRRDAAVAYARAHWRSLPRVVLARIGRTLDVYALGDLLHMDTGEEKYLWASWSAIVSFWIALPLGLFGLTRLLPRLRWILLVPVATVVVSTVVFYGAHRIRSSAEPTIVVCVAVACCWWADRRGRARTPESELAVDAR